MHKARLTFHKTIHENSDNKKNLTINKNSDAKIYINVKRKIKYFFACKIQNFLK